MECRKLCKNVLRFCLTLQIVWGMDEVVLLNPPEEPADHLLKVLYSCDEPALIHLECVVTFDTGTTSTLPLRRWTCVPGDPKVRALKLTFPDWLVYQADGIVPDAPWVLSSFLRVSLGYSGSEGGVLQDVAPLRLVPLLRRPFKPHRICLAWSARMLGLSQNQSKTQCPMEEETVHLLSSLYASTGENFGITKTLRRFNSEVLENLRLRSFSFPWCMFSVWLFVIAHCRHGMCGVIHHIDSNDNYVTPAMFLTSSGHIHVQMTLESGASSAFLCPFQVPLRQWCHVAVTLRGRTVTVSMACTDGKRQTVQSADHRFSRAVELDDTEGYFVVGGGKYVTGVEGYYGPLAYHRNRIPPYDASEVVVPKLIKNINLTGWLRTCQHLQMDLNAKIIGYSLRAKREAADEGCYDAFYNLMEKTKETVKSQCEPWEVTSPQRRRSANLAKLLAFEHGGRGVALEDVGRALYSSSLLKLDKATSLEVVGRIVPLLLQAGCLGHHQALHVSSVLYRAGLGVRRQPNKAWLLALLAAQQDSRLSLLHLGHFHHQGDGGLSPDPDLAYAYYANVAKQTRIDRQNPSPLQAFVESVYLNNEEVLELQTNENHHIFQWLKLQARNGVADAEQAIGRMLFWGQQGVSPNIQMAVRHYERGAVRLEDPVSMYDYAIVLMQGQGVEQDVPRAVAFLERAMEQGYAPAINALAWYYEQFEKDYGRAVQLWEQADLHGSPDAAMNLGVMYSQGLYPGKSANQLTAFKYFLKSAQRGHISGAAHLSEIWTTGIHGQIERRPSDAVMWAKWAAEHNGYLGIVLQKALDSYLKNDILRSLLHYMMAAEAGFATAQFNVAYLCEQNSGGFLDPAFASYCMKRYYNQTIHSQNPDTYALIKMGDLLYEEHVDGHTGLLSAAHMYKQAALRKDPQGWYNLGLLAEEGYKLPLSLLIELGLPELYLADPYRLLTTFYSRCRDSEATESNLPCSLALFSVYLQSFQKDYGAAITFSSAAVAVVAAPPILFVILGRLRGRGPSRR